MPKYVSIVAYLSVDDLASRYRKATDPIERSHFQIIWLLAEAKTRQSSRGEYWLLCQLDADSRSSLQPGGATSSCRPAPAQSRCNALALEGATGTIEANL